MDRESDVRPGDDRDATVARASRPVETNTQSIRVEDIRRPDVGVAEARARFGGIDVPASLVGMLTALALTTLLAGLVGAAIGAVGYQTGLDGDDVDDISIASLAGGVAILFLSFLIGGWAAARIARYDGPRNGLMTAVWALLLAAILSGLAAWLGEEYDVFRNVDLPQWFSTEALTTAAIASGIAAIAAMLIGGLLGGMWGERYHRRADATIVGTLEGAIRRDVGVERPGAVREGGIRHDYEAEDR